LFEALQVCVTYNNLYEFYNKNVYEAEVVDLASFDEALHMIKKWDYNSEAPIAIGKFYAIERLGYEENYSGFKLKTDDRLAKIKQVLEKFI